MSGVEGCRPRGAYWGPVLCPGSPPGGFCRERSSAGWEPGRGPREENRLDCDYAASNLPQGSSPLIRPLPTHVAGARSKRPDPCYTAPCICMQGELGRDVPDGTYGIPAPRMTTFTYALPGGAR